MARTRTRFLQLEDRLAPSVTLVKDINRDVAGAYRGFDINRLVAVNDKVLFQPPANDFGPAWTSDGTPAGTHQTPGVQFNIYDKGVEFAGARYFAGFDPAHGSELWRTDGTANGTRLILDTLIGPPSGYPRLLTVAGNTLYFVANGNQVWRSDGTTAGTFPIRSIGFINYNYGGDGEYIPYIHDMAAAGNRVYIQTDVIQGSELWTSNGTYAGTRRVADLKAAGGFLVNKLLGAAGNSFYFIADSPASGVFRLWVTDGTAAGTKPVRDGLYSPYGPGQAVALGGKLYFVANDGISGDELWVTDGTAAGTALVKDINPTGNAKPEDLVVRGSYLYFTADDGTTGRELWRTDGTGTGTIPLGDLFPGTVSSDPEFLTPAAGGLYFSATSPTTGKELWVTDGTPGGTVQVADLEPGPGSSFPTWLTAVGDRVFWVGNTQADGSALWVIGPGTGPTLVSPVPAKTNDSTNGSGVTIGGVRYFGASDGTSSGAGIWRTDGTAAGTWMLKDVVPSLLTAVDGTLYFTAVTPDAGTQLWASDGTPGGTRIVRGSVAGGGGYTSPTGLTAFQGKLIFTASTAAEGSELWVSDGTAVGTHLVKDINPGTGSSFPNSFIEMNGYLYFVALGTQLWRTDGTEGGTTFVTDLPATPFGQYGVWEPVRVGNRLIFWGRSGSATTLWATDGTAGGTVLLGQLTPAYGAFPGIRVVLGDRLLFWAKDATHPAALWATDGTPEGTIRVRSGAPHFAPVAAGDFAYYTGSVDDQELWRTDGTPSGTVLLRTFTKPVRGLTALGGRPYFIGYDLLHGFGLWTTDGTAAGTHLVDDLVAGPQPKIGRPDGLFVLGNALFLEVYTVGESTLWRSDGTAAGTHAIATGYYSPVDELNGVALFIHDDGKTGGELWRYDPITTGTDHYNLEDGLRLDVPAATGLLANDADGGGQRLTATLLTKPKNGWLTLRPDGSFTYQPFSRDFSGTDTFTYRAEAGGEQSAPVTVSIDVDLVNQAPVPRNDTAAGRAGSPVAVRVLANDADPDNDTLTIASFTQGASGQVSKVGTALVYTPRVAGALTDTFSYTVRDPRGATATATVTIALTVQPQPRITAVRLFPGPGTGSINLAAATVLPFQRLSRVEVAFSGDVSVAADDLKLVGADGGPYALSGFAYDAARRTASWLIDGPAVATWADRLTFLIDGSATGVTGPAGDPIGDWSKTVSLLVGDLDGDGMVTAVDLAAVKSRFGTVAGSQRLWADLDGNGVVDAADAALVTANLGTRKV